MSIKGFSQVLFVGKEASHMITFWGNNKRIDYKDLKKVEYFYAENLEVGYLKFIGNDNKCTRFEFPSKANPKIEKTVDLIHKNMPDLILIEYRAEDLKFHQKWWFSILMMFCCLAPIGLFLIWSNKKFTYAKRFLITFLMIALWGVGIYHYVNAINSISNMYDQVIAPVTSETDILVTESESEIVQKAEAFTTTLTTGHYVVGTDIPVGTYNFFSKKGTGNLISSDGTVNVIFDHIKESGKNIGLDNFGTEELKNIYLEKDVIISVTGNQEISAGCDDGLVESMQGRNQEGLEEIEIGYGNYGASDDIPAGTYDIELIEGTGNIISTNIESGINEIMGESTDDNVFSKTLITRFRNLTLNEGDVLEVKEIKVKLIPSK